ncbi:MAG: polysaccharide pyruvyl transferase family protein [Sedimentisphaerales bacterium]|nr:polysaccharide pyruvyl transferase family protein [Sedimentisphaerales bacterium]
MDEEGMIAVNLVKKTKDWISTILDHYRPARFYDLSRIPAGRRIARSKVIQFYSAVNNIGNYTPVLGIRRLIQHQPDTWNVHDRAIDFDFVNRHYTHAIIGGGGLLHPVFEPFWRRFHRECRLATAVWGIGLCLPNGSDGWSVAGREAVRAVMGRADLVNVRDAWTAEYFGLDQADIGPCPTIAYLLDFMPCKDPGGYCLFSWHDQIVSSEQAKAFLKSLRGSSRYKIKSTNNKQYPGRGVHRIVKGWYCSADMVVTTRLHGAIIAYGLGIPYVAIPVDRKITEFYRMYGNGIIVEPDDLDQVQHVEDLIGAIRMTQIRMEDVLRFGRKVKEWIGQPPTDHNTVQGMAL